jgi:hypothetical protein
MAGGIYRKKKESNYVVLDKHCLQNTSLSWAAKGLHSYLMGLPDDWKVTVSDLKNRSKDGRDATSSAMHSLIQAGYVVRESEHDKAGRFAGYNYYVFETPEQASEFLSTSTISGLTVYGFSENGKTENGKPVTTKYYNNQITNKLIEEEETRESELSTVEEKPLLEEENSPAPAAQNPAQFTAFDIDLAAADMTTDFRCVERFARLFDCSTELATEKHPKAVKEFVEDQKTVGTVYHADRQFRAHYFAWLPKRAAAKRAEKQAYQAQQANTTFIPKNVPVFR